MGIETLNKNKNLHLKLVILVGVISILKIDAVSLNSDGSLKIFVSLDDLFLKPPVSLKVDVSLFTDTSLKEILSLKPYVSLKTDVSLYAELLCELIG